MRERVGPIALSRAKISLDRIRERRALFRPHGLEHRDRRGRCLWHELRKLLQLIEDPHVPQLDDVSMCETIREKPRAQRVGVAEPRPRRRRCRWRRWWRVRYRGG